jgi:hypothetical protein
LSDGFQGPAVEFYSTHEIVDQNESLEVHEFCPGYLAIANDTGTGVALLEAAEHADRVHLNRADDMKTVSMHDTGMTLEEWITEGCPFSFSPKPLVSAVEQVCLQLDVMPPGGLKGLMEVKKMASLEIGLSELKEIERRLPYSLGEMSYIKALRLAEKINALAECVSIWTVSAPRVRLSLNNPFQKVGGNEPQ